MLSVEKEHRGETPVFDLPLTMGENRIERTNAVLYLLPLGAPPPEDCKNYPFTATANICSSAVVGALRARTRRAGDVILHGGHHKTVRRLATIAHLAPTVRARMPLLTDDEGPLAVPFGPTRDGAAKDPDLTVYFCFA